MPSILPREIFSLLWQNVNSRALVNETLVAFRRTESLPSIGAAAPEFIDGVGWSDHWSFWQEGFPAIEITRYGTLQKPLLSHAARHTRSFELLLFGPFRLGDARGRSTSHQSNRQLKLFSASQSLWGGGK